MADINFIEKEKLRKLKLSLEQQSAFTLYTNNEAVLIAYERMINPNK